MNAAEFISRWNAKLSGHDFELVTAPSSLRENGALPDSAARFLVGAGLPRDCAPFLSFDAIVKGPVTLPTLYGRQQFRDSDLTRLDAYYVLGSDGAGNPICLDTNHGEEIFMLDHEDRFRTRTFVSSNVAKLAEALLIIQTVPYEKFVEHLQRFDPPAADASSFLPREVAMLID